MAEEYINQGGVCSGNWWSPSMNMLFGGGFSPCSGAASDMTSFGWLADSKFGGLAASANSDWTQAMLFGGGGASDGIRDPNPSNIMHESGSSDSSQIQNDWSPGLTGNFAGKLVEDHGDSTPIGAFKNQIHYPAQSSESYANYDVSSSSGYPSSMIKSFLLDQPAPSLFENRTNLPAVDYSSGLVPGYGSSCSSPLLKPINSSLPNPTQPGRLHFSNNTPYWNASAAALDDIRASLLGSVQSALSGSSLVEKPNLSHLIRKNFQANSQYSQASGTVEKKVSPEPASKRPRIETPSPLPTFKVRKEKLGDRITALQQLVSPFGKTDTASVLHEAIEYIKFLHDQVNALSTPYMKSGAPFQQQDFTDKAVKATEGPQRDLRSRGLCLVPISSTFPVTSDNPSDFWTPTFGGSGFR